MHPARKDRRLHANSSAMPIIPAMSFASLRTAFYILERGGFAGGTQRPLAQYGWGAPGGTSDKALYRTCGCAIPALRST